MPDLKYDRCDEWLILAKDQDGNTWYVVTELWDEWNKYPEDADQEEFAIEKYMLPYALKHWNKLPWRMDTEEDEE